MTNKKSSLWRFFFSLIPGAGEMYMGFLKMGVSLMTLFIAVIFIASSLRLYALVVADIIVWFYSFFHVHNLASLSDEEFYSLEDKYLFCTSDSTANQTELFRQNRKIVAGILIFAGIVMAWNGFLAILEEILPWQTYRLLTYFGYEIPRICVGCAIIILGILMIRGKKKTLDDADLKKENPNGKEN